MKKWLVANLLAALGVFALIGLTIACSFWIHSHRFHLAWRISGILAAGFAFFCVANRGLWRSRGPILRGLAIVLLSAALTVAAYVGSFAAVMVARAFVGSIPACVSGRVVDAAGQPVAGARLRLFETQAEWGEAQESRADLFRGFAEEIGLDMAAYDAAVADPATAERVELDFEEGQALGVSSTPTFFLDGELLELQEWDDLENAIQAAVNGGR